MINDTTAFDTENNYRDEKEEKEKTNRITIKSGLVTWIKMPTVYTFSKICVIESVYS